MTEITLKIILNIRNEQMHCSTCTSTVESTVRETLPHYTKIIIKAYDKDQSPIRDCVCIEGVQCSDNIKTFIPLLTTLTKAISAVGFDCKEMVQHEVFANGKQINMNALLQSTQTSAGILINVEEGTKKVTDYYYQDNVPSPIKKNTTSYSNIAIGSGMISLGTAIMIVEHFNKIDNLNLELSVGAVSTALTLITGKDYFRNAIRHQGAMDTLISLGCGGAILYSFLLIIQPPYLKDENASSFFDVPLMILGFLTLSHALRTHIENQIKSQENKINQRKAHLPENATLETESTVSVYQIAPGTRIKIEPGETVPIDGKLIEWTIEDDLLFNESFLTGNERKNIKKTGDVVYAGTHNDSHASLLLETTCLVNDSLIFTTLFHLQTQAKNDTLIEWVIKNFLRGVLSIATISAICWGLFGPEPAANHAIQVFLSVVLSACPCGLGLLSLNETMIKLLALEHGMMIQSEKAFCAHEATVYCIDKCGTITEGKFELENIQSISSKFSEENLLGYAIALQDAIPHKDRTAITHAFLEDKRKKSIYTATHYEANPVNFGRGGRVTIADKKVTIGNQALLNFFGINTDNHNNSAETLTKPGDMMLYCAVDNEVVGYYVMKPVVETEQNLRQDFIYSMNYLIQAGKKIHILTGDDSEKNARNIAHQLHKAKIDTILCPAMDINKINTSATPSTSSILIIYGMLPADKKQHIKNLQSQQKIVAMIGDGTNDIPALQAANIGLVINNDAEAQESADVTLNGHFSSIIHLISLSKSYSQAYLTSMVTAFGSNAALIGASAGVLYPLTQQMMSPMIMGMGMGGSSLVLVAVIAIWQLVAKSRLNKLGIENSSTQTSFNLYQSSKEVHSPLTDAVAIKAADVKSESYSTTTTCLNQKT